MYIKLIDCETKKTEGKKNDQDNYEKVDYSLIPIGLIELYLSLKVHGDVYNKDILLNKDFQLFQIIHNLFNDLPCLDDYIPVMLECAIKDYGIDCLAVSLGMGLSKYNERDNWKKFDSDPERFLKAALRHLMMLIRGEYFDGEAIDGYIKGNDHRGAVLFCLMVVDNIIKCKDKTIEKSNGVGFFNGMW